jgi:hypothetical protein
MHPHAQPCTCGGYEAASLHFSAKLVTAVNLHGDGWFRATNRTASRTTSEISPLRAPHARSSIPDDGMLCLTTKYPFVATTKHPLVAVAQQLQRPT